MEMKQPESKYHEGAMLSCMMQDMVECAGNALSTFGQANPCFYPEHAAVYDAMLMCSGKAMDFISVADYLQSCGKLETIGGVDFLRTVMNVVSHTANYQKHRDWVKKLYQSRLVQADLHARAMELSNPNCKLGDTISSVESNSNKVMSDYGGSQIMSIGDAVDEAWGSWYEKDQIVNLFMPGLDQALEKVPLGSLMCVAARPGCGKSSLLVHMILQQGLAGVPSYMASLEMPKAQVLARMIGNIMGKRDAWIYDQANSATVRQALDELSKLPIYIEDKPSISVYDWCRKCKRLRKEKGVLVAALDYIQRANVAEKKGESRTEAIARACREMKNTMLEQKMFGIMLAQLNRQATDGMPRISHLRECGDIENECDEILLLHSEDIDAEGVARVKAGEPIELTVGIGKNRHGPQGLVRMGWTKPFTRFECNRIQDYEVPQ